MGPATAPVVRARRLLAWLVLALATAATAAAASLGALAIPAGTAHADNTLVSSTPANNETLAASPTSMTFTFAEQLGPAATAVVACNGEPFPVGQVQIAADLLTATVPVPNPMPKGTCNVVLTVSSPDSQPNGSVAITFNVTADAAPVVTTVPADITPGSTVAGDTSGTVTPADTVAPDLGTTGASATDEGTDGAPRVGGPLGLARLLAALSIAVLFGSFVLIVVAWPEGVEYILTVRFLRLVWGVAVGSSVLVAILLRAQLTGSSIGASLSPTSWIDLKDSGPGLAALTRVAFAGGCGWAVMRPERVLEQQSQLAALGLPALAVATFGFSRSGGDLALVGYAAGAVHALAMAVWLGGVVLLTRVVLAGPGEDDLVHAVRGFSRISTPALLLTVVTGAVQTWRLDRGALFDSSHGRVLLRQGACRRGDGVRRPRHAAVRRDPPAQGRLDDRRDGRTAAPRHRHGGRRRRARAGAHLVAAVVHPGRPGRDRATASTTPTPTAGSSWRTRAPTSRSSSPAVWVATACGSR
jgi:copper transport protein